MKSEIVIVDYKVGNIGSILNMFKKIGVIAKLSSEEEDLLNAKRLLLPGVGAFDKGMRNLNSSGLTDVLKYKVLEEKTPILGICLGMQLLLNKSEEGSEPGLGWIKGEVKKFDFTKKQLNLKVPHMGWNLTHRNRPDILLNELEQNARFYFVHSYYAVCDDDFILATTDYGIEFASIIKNNHIYGAQFHPEKSHKFGMQLLKNFMDVTIC